MKRVRNKRKKDGRGIQSKHEQFIKMGTFRETSDSGRKLKADEINFKYHRTDHSVIPRAAKPCTPESVKPS